MIDDDELKELALPCLRLGDSKAEPEPMAFTLYSSFFKTVNKMPPEEQVRFVMKTLRFGAYNDEPGFNGWQLESAFEASRVSIEGSRERIANAQQNGKKGGRPRKEKPTE
jgi:hypothetical protein